MDGAPDAAMMAPVEKIARFIASGDEACLTAFADGDVAILENFAPHLFTGADAVVLWAKQMREHTAKLSGLAHTFGPAQDFRVDGDRAFFSLPTHWTGTANGRRFEEDGGWAFLLVKQAAERRVRSYGWAVTRNRLSQS